MRAFSATATASASPIEIGTNSTVYSIVFWTDLRNTGSCCRAR